ncbi:MAG: Coenzyme F420 hydrogenase/dehydrogenase, beta subunit C-terminal domain [Desulfobacterales bacterium]|nr:Coenzyme F420 hydrogenase/dehydrogenase, beta subunit C-terminal domain [Desulfobacterales bacterium]
MSENSDKKMAKNNVYSEVVANNLCIGCGICVLICPEKALDMVVCNGTYTPRVAILGACISCGTCISSCPGIGFDGGIDNLEVALKKFSGDDCHEAWVASAKDRKIRAAASAGGVITAISTFAIDKGIVDGIVLTRMSREDPLRGEMFFARTADECRDSIGSKYCPVSLAAVEELLDPELRVLVVGLPCHIQAARFVRGRLGAEKNTLYLGLVCGGHMVRFEGTDYWLRRFGIAQDRLGSIIYRTGTLPGTMYFLLRDGSKIALSHLAFWRHLFRGLFWFSPFRCRLCIDCVSMFADISCGTNWGERLGATGSTLVVARTAKGNNLFRDIINSGVVEAQPISKQYVRESYKPYLRNVMANSKIRGEFARRLGRSFFHWPGDSAIISNLDRVAFYMQRRRSELVACKWLWPLNPPFLTTKAAITCALRVAGGLLRKLRGLIRARP